MSVINKNPDALAGAVRANRIVYADKTNRIQTASRPQLRRLGDSSSNVAFVETGDGGQLGWLARGRIGWTAVRTGAHDAWPFPTALKAFRSLVGGKQ